MINTNYIISSLALVAFTALVAFVVKWGKVFFKMDERAPQAKTAEELRELAKTTLNTPLATPLKGITKAEIPSQENLHTLITLLSQKILDDNSWDFVGAFRVTGEMPERDAARKNLYSKTKDEYPVAVQQLDKDGLFATTLLKGLVLHLDDFYGQKAIRDLQGTSFTDLMKAVAQPGSKTLLHPSTLSLAFPAIQGLKI